MGEAVGDVTSSDIDGIGGLKEAIGDGTGSGMIGLMGGAGD